MPTQCCTLQNLNLGVAAGGAGAARSARPTAAARRQLWLLMIACHLQGCWQSLGKRAAVCAAARARLVGWAAGQAAVHCPYGAQLPADSCQQAVARLLLQAHLVPAIDGGGVAAPAAHVPTCSQHPLGTLEGRGGGAGRGRGPPPPRRTAWSSTTGYRPGPIVCYHLLTISISLNLPLRGAGG